jgi:hypothetical protein
LSFAANTITVTKTFVRTTSRNCGALGRLPGPPWLHWSYRNSILVRPKYMFPYRELFLSEGGIVFKIFSKLNAFLVTVHFEVQ